MDTETSQQPTAKASGDFIPKPKPKIPDKDFLTMKIGDVQTIAGIKCKLQHINRGRRRLTFVPVSHAQVMPVEEMRNPVRRVDPPLKR